MSARNEIAPSTLGVELTDEGIAVEYLDGRSVFYHGVPQKAAGSLQTAPGKDVHVLVTDPDETEGVLVYVNDRKTTDEILESTGVGRVLIADGQRSDIFPGVTVAHESYRFEITVDHATVGGRVFVFEEDEMGERSFEIVQA